VQSIAPGDGQGEAPGQWRQGEGEGAMFHVKHRQQHPSTSGPGGLARGGTVQSWVVQRRHRAVLYAGDGGHPVWRGGKPVVDLALTGLALDVEGVSTSTGDGAAKARAAP